MGSWRRMGAFLGLVPEDESRAGDYGYADEDYEQTFAPEYPAARGRDGSSRAGRDAGHAEPVVHGALAMQVRPDVRQSAEPAVSGRPVTVKLTGFGEARIIGERYRDGASVILDMSDLTDGDARRVVDFAAGLAFALRGSIDKVTARVFMLLPPHVDMSAEDRRAFAGTYARS